MRKLDLGFTDNIIYKEGERFLELSSTIIKILPLNDSVVVLLQFLSDAEDRNIFCYDFNGAFKWQVSAPDKILDRNYFTGIYLTDDSLCAYSYSGVEYVLDKESGHFLSSRLIK